MNLEDFFKYAVAMLSGGIGLELVKYYINLKRTKIEYEKGTHEIDTMVAEKWIRLCEELKRQMDEQKKEFALLKVDYYELNEKYISLQHQISFGSKN